LPALYLSCSLFSKGFREGEGKSPLVANALKNIVHQKNGRLRVSLSRGLFLAEKKELPYF
jgi:hypothetical protein